MAGIALWLTSAARAGIDVRGTNHATLAEAIAAAVDGDTLVFDGGTYEGGVGVVGMALVFEGNGSTLERTTAGDEIVELLGGASLTARDLTFSSTTSRGIDASAGASVVLVDVTFQTAVGVGNGGAIHAVDPAGIDLQRVVFDRTTAGGTAPNGQGGALKVSSTNGSVVTLTDVAFDTTAASTQGGAIWVSGATLACVRCTFDGTTSGAEGGAVYDNGGGALSFGGSSFAGTAAGAGGGAIRAASPLDVSGSTFCATGTAAGTGGAVSSVGGGGSLTNNVFLDTTVSGLAPGAAVRLATGTWTVLQNHFLSAAGGSDVVSTQSADLELADNLFAYNEGAALALTGGTLLAGSPRFDAFFANGSVGVATDADDVLDDPRLVDFVDDGVCGNDALWPRADSPLLDAGDPADADPDGGRADIGAFGGAGADPALHDDGDGDTFSFLQDCDDGVATVHPGALEGCDGVDNDCDAAVDEDPTWFQTFFPDCDGDGQGLLAGAATGCAPPDAVCDWVAWNVTRPYAGGDCDDTDSAVFLGAPESCATGDQDCDGDGSAEELGVADGSTFWLDGDLDGAGDPLRAVEACFARAGVVSDDRDCDDGDAGVFPGAYDPCGDSVDQDCSGTDGVAAEERAYYPDTDGDAFGDETALPVRSCQSAFAQHVLDHTDCDDGDPDVRPDAAEVCNGTDDNCNDEVDTDAGVPVVYYQDLDGDGAGNDEVRQETPCGAPPDFTTEGGDCDDADPEVHRGHDEVCNEVDDDCDAFVDVEDPDVADAVAGWVDFDGDGFGTCGSDPECLGALVCGLGAAPDGTVYVDNALDCDDVAAGVNPAADEVPGNTVDEDCAGGAAAPPGGPVRGGGGGCNCEHAAPPHGAVALGPLLLLLRRRRR